MLWGWHVEQPAYVEGWREQSEVRVRVRALGQLTVLSWAHYLTSVCLFAP